MGKGKRKKTKGCNWKTNLCMGGLFGIGSGIGGYYAGNTSCSAVTRENPINQTTMCNETNVSRPTSAERNNTLDKHDEMLNDALNNPLFSGNTPGPTKDTTFQGMYFAEIWNKMSSSDFNITKLKKWLDQGLDPNMVDSRGRTLLMFASKYNLIEIFEILLRSKNKKVNLNQKDDYGYNVFDYVKNYPLIKKLLSLYRKN